VTIIDHTELADLRDLVTGPVLAAGDPALAAEAAAFNLAVTHHPVAVVGATSAADVAAAVRWAAARGLPVAVQATGHGPSVPADGAVLVSTRRMTGVWVNPATMTARVEAGTRWEQVIHEAAVFGLAPLNGSSHLMGGGLHPRRRDRPDGPRVRLRRRPESSWVVERL
jgi:FAD/FMN-containing dehydrogenase